MKEENSHANVILSNVEQHLRSWQFLKGEKILSKLASKSYLNVDLRKSIFNYGWGLHYFIRGFFREAIEYFETSEKHLKLLLSTPGSTANQLYAKLLDYSGMAHIEMDRYEEGLDLLRLGQKEKEKNFPPHHPEFLISLIHWGSYFGIMGDFHKQRKYYWSAFQLLQNMPEPSPLWKAAMYTNLGYAAANLGYIDQAREYHDQAMEIYIQQFHRGHPLVGLCENNIGFIYRKKGLYKRALKFHKKSLDKFEKSQVKHTYTYRISFNLGVVHRELQEWDQAFNYFQEVLEKREKSFSTGHRHVASTHANIGKCYLAQRVYMPAMEHLQIALKKRTLIWGRGSKHRHLGLTHRQLSQVYLGFGKFELALEHAEISLAITNFLFHEYSRKTISIDRNLIANCHINLQQYGHARKYINENLISPTTLQEKRLLTESYRYNGVAYYLEKNLTQAHHWLSKALQLCSEPSNIEKEDIILRSAILNDVAELQLQMDQPEEALQNTHQALKLLCPSFQPSSILQNPKLNNLLDSVNVLRALQIKARAMLRLLRASDDSKQISWIDVYRNFKKAFKFLDELFIHQDTKEVQLMLIDQEKVLVEEAVAFLSELYRDSQEEKYLHWALTSVEQRKATLFLNQVSEKIRSSVSTKYLENRQKKLVQSIQEELKPGTVLLNYFCAARGIYIFIITLDQVHLEWMSYQKCGIRDINELYEELTEHLNKESKSTNKKIGQNFGSLLQRLQKLLVHPIEAYLPKGKGRIGILPDGHLFAIPFKLLFDLSWTETPSNDITFSRSTCVFYHFSLRSLLFSIGRRQITKHQEDSLLIIMPGFYLKAKNFKNRLKSNLLYSFQKKQVRTIELFGHEANRKKVLDQLDKAKYILFFTHFDQDLEEPFILLAGNERLYLKDIISCNADLVILMGCSSGQGPVLKGREGLNSFARAFLASGAGYVIATLTEIDDQLALTLLNGMVRKTIRGMDIPKALSEAQAELTATGAFNPIAINSFIVFGSWSSEV